MVKRMSKDIRLDPESGTVSYNGRIRRIGPLTFAVATLLCKGPHKYRDILRWLNRGATKNGGVSYTHLGAQLTYMRRTFRPLGLQIKSTFPGTGMYEKGTKVMLSIVDAETGKRVNHVAN